MVFKLRIQRMGYCVVNYALDAVLEIGKHPLQHLLQHPRKLRPEVLLQFVVDASIEILQDVLIDFDGERFHLLRAQCGQPCASRAACNDVGERGYSFATDPRAVLLHQRIPFIQDVVLFCHRGFFIKNPGIG